MSFDILTLKVEFCLTSEHVSRTVEPKSGSFRAHFMRSRLTVSTVSTALLGRLWQTREKSCHNLNIIRRMCKVAAERHFACTFFDLNSTLHILDSMFRVISPLGGFQTVTNCQIVTVCGDALVTFDCFYKWQIDRRKLRSK